MKIYHLILALPLLLMAACGPPGGGRGPARQGVGYCSYEWPYVGASTRDSRRAATP